MKIFKDRDIRKTYLILTATGLLALGAVILLTSGNYFHWFFWDDDRMMGSDFFHSLAETYRGDPYGSFSTLYTPLSNLFFYILQFFVPESVKSGWPSDHLGVIELRMTENDLRAQQSTMMMYLLFVLLVSMGYILAISCRYGKYGSSAAATGCAVVLSYGSLAAMERGNIISLTVLLVLLFVFGYDSEDPRIRELSYIALAAAAALKLYPALFGLLILLDKRWWAAVRCGLYGLVLGIAPVFAFGGMPDLKLFYRALTQFGEELLLAHGYGMRSIVYHGSLIISGLTGSGTAAESFDAVAGPGVRTVSALLLVISMVILLVCAILHERKWEKCLDLALMILLVQSQSNDYSLMVFIPALVMMLFDEEKLSGSNAVYVISLFLLCLAYPTREIKGGIMMDVGHANIVQIVSLVLVVREAWYLVGAIKKKTGSGKDR